MNPRRRALLLSKAAGFPPSLVKQNQTTATLKHRNFDQHHWPLIKTTTKSHFYLCVQSIGDGVNGARCVRRATVRTGKLCGTERESGGGCAVRPGPGTCCTRDTWFSRFIDGGGFPLMPSGLGWGRRRRDVLGLPHIDFTIFGWFTHGLLLWVNNERRWLPCFYTHRS